ncbi:hypothetical protein SAMN05216429_101357 [Marinobacter persicus]|uniref:VCBS repeat-containing protein n=1 Tax=Marinobacter persicus TaxID=930118 RepID=A0A1I3Q113_9GAMM|nr:hypothetical protein [Marinobacter persicus]GHD51885.1 hypothetical protein GCM10008110_24080 [Marinobacter persicus]SFJ26846.1 hypothetical protein SAMN05216429_101357 [Marinobacter persicus]
MIASSQISFTQNSTRQVSAMDASQLRIRQQAPASQEAQTGASQRSLFRQAAYHYSSQEQLAFSSSSQVQCNDRTASYTSAEFVEQSSELFLLGQQALTVSRAALGGDTVAEPQASVSVQAGQYLFYSESETRSFASSGSITLENGESIDFTLSLRQSQSRSYEYSELVQIQERPMTDPLVINFGSTTAQLTDSLFEFDMNGDGKTGEFASLGSGSGYLVFDRNGNGKVDNGSELFGPKSGSGFSELAAFDDDGNRWIDANDDIFSQLQVWVQTAEGDEELRSLKDVGVQALYVDSAQDRFTLTNPQGVPLGQIKASGIYLTTDGEVRTLEELDLAEQNTETVPPVETSLGVTGAGRQSNGNSDGNGRTDARIAAIEKALEKLEDIRQQQKEFLEAGKPNGEKKSPLDDYMNLIDRLRLEMLNSQDEKKQAASRYLEFAKL